MERINLAAGTNIVVRNHGKGDEMPAAAGDVTRMATHLSNQAGFDPGIPRGSTAGTPIFYRANIVGITRNRERTIIRLKANRAGHFGQHQGQLSRRDAVEW